MRMILIFIIVTLFFVSIVSAQISITPDNKKQQIAESGFHWIIENKTGAESRLSISSNNIDDHNSNICIHNLDDITFLNDLLKEHEDITQYPIKLLSKESQAEISSLKTDLSKLSNTICMNMTFDDPETLLLKIGFNSVSVTAGYTHPYNTFHNLVKTWDGSNDRLVYCYEDSSNDPGAYYNTDYPYDDSWSNGYDYSTTSIYPTCIPWGDNSGKLTLAYIYDTTTDYSRYLDMTATALSASGTLIDPAQMPQYGVACDIDENDDYHCFSRDNYYIATYRDRDYAQQQLSDDAIYVNIFVTPDGCDISLIDRQSDYDIYSNIVCDNSADGWTQVATSGTNYHFPGGVSSPNGTYYVTATQGTSYLDYIWISNDNASTWSLFDQPFTDAGYDIYESAIYVDKWENIIYHGCTGPFRGNWNIIGIFWAENQSWSFYNTSVTAQNFWIQGTLYPQYNRINGTLHFVYVNTTAVYYDYWEYYTPPAPPVDRCDCPNPSANWDIGECDITESCDITGFYLYINASDRANISNGAVITCDKDSLKGSYLGANSYVYLTGAGTWIDDTT